MSTEKHKEIVRRYYAIVDDGDVSPLAGEVLSPAFRLHFDSMPEMDRDGAFALLTAFLTAFPGIRHEIEDQLAEGDRVATRLVAYGVHQGDFMGIPPTGKEIAIKAINIHRIEDGRIAEQWVVSDGVGLLRQMEVTPAAVA